MAKFKIKEFLNSNVFITPTFMGSVTRRFKLSVKKILFYMLVYTLLTFILVSLLYLFTPARQIVLIFENKQLKEQAVRIRNLERKIILLTKELESISSTNQKLKYAIILAGADTSDSNSAVLDSLRKTDDGKLPTGGDLFFVIKHFWYKYFNSDSGNNDIFFIKPSNGFIIRGFNPNKGHLGIDFAIKKGSPIYASAGGLVVFSDFTPNDGKKIIIEHRDGFISIYKHCSSLLKKERDFVYQGDLIALSGNSGLNTTGPHLHFEIWKNGKAVNPENYLINR